MNLKIKESTPLKYHLNMHLMKSFIERDSIAFELIKYVSADIQSNDKEMELSNFKFTSRTLKYVFGDKMEEEGFKEYLISKLKEMISLKWINPENKSMFITREMIEKFYSIT